MFGLDAGLDQRIDDAICAQPRAEPLPNARPMRGRLTREHPARREETRRSAANQGGTSYEAAGPKAIRSWEAAPSLKAYLVSGVNLRA